MDKLDFYSTKVINMIIDYAPQFTLAVIVLVLGLWIIKWITKGIRISMEKSKTNPTLIPFMTNLISWGFKALLLISVASMVGIATTSFVAVLGAAGLAIGLALQGSLSNFAGGVLILLNKPYAIGDFIEAQGHMGTVREIQIFNTILISIDNKRIIIPNGAVSNGSIVNFSVEGTRRVDMVFGISYSSDIAKAKEVLMNLLLADTRVFENPAPFIAVSELADSSVNLIVRPWCNSSDYWGIYWDMMEKGKMELEAAGITIPFPQRDVHTYHHTAES
ncbi:mechanosensitive ion channel family protein [Bacteroidota bacterium]